MKEAPRWLGKDPWGLLNKERYTSHSLQRAFRKLDFVTDALLTRAFSIVGSREEAWRFITQHRETYFSHRVKLPWRTGRKLTVAYHTRHSRFALYDLLTLCLASMDGPRATNSSMIPDTYDNTISDCLTTKCLQTE